MPVSHEVQHQFGHTQRMLFGVTVAQVHGARPAFNRGFAGRKNITIGFLRPFKEPGVLDRDCGGVCAELHDIRIELRDSIDQRALQHDQTDNF
jgi:hypothetical protein